MFRGVPGMMNRCSTLRNWLAGRALTIRGSKPVIHEQPFIKSANIRNGRKVGLQKNSEVRLFEKVYRP
jgi:hypothetical protein